MSSSDARAKICSSVSGGGVGVGVGAGGGGGGGVGAVVAGAEAGGGGGIGGTFFFPHAPAPTRARHNTPVKMSRRVINRLLVVNCLGCREKLTGSSCE